jgi:hypothetical protein
LESSIAENNIDLYSSNLGNLPILARVGSKDQTVPPLHSRRLVRLIDEWSKHSNSINYVEQKDGDHWFDGILNDAIAQEFLMRFIDPKKNPDLRLPQLPNPFVISTLNPASSGSRGGIRIMQLVVPFRYPIFYSGLRPLKLRNLIFIGNSQPQMLGDLDLLQMNGKMKFGHGLSITLFSTPSQQRLVCPT